MKNSYLKAAMILGTILVVWSVICLNIFGIIGSIFSWAAYSRGSKKAAFTAMVFYILTAVISAVISADMFGSAYGSSLEPLVYAAGMHSAIGIIPMVICALLSYKGGKKLENNGSENDGFFE